MSKKTIEATLGAVCVIVAVIFCHAETMYFGNNLWPATRHEMACDLVSLLLCIAGLRLLYSASR